MIPRPATSTLFPYTTLFRSSSTTSSSPGSVCSCAGSGSTPATSRTSSPTSTGRATSGRTSGSSTSSSAPPSRSEEHTSELQSLTNLVCRLLLEKKNNNYLQC